MEPDFKNLTCGVAGLGLIGGSIAKALKLKAGVKEVIGWNHRQTAVDNGIGDGILSDKSSSNIECLKGCGVIYICTPVGLITETALKLYKLSPESIITDAASTKAKIMESIRESAPDMRFIGGHPMAGSEKTGYGASSQSLFENAYYVLCKSEGASTADFSVIEALAQNMGAITVSMEPNDHDRAVALISHLPHVAASSLSRLAGIKDSGELSMLAAGGFRDITRIASSSEALWSDILKNNNKMVREALRAYIEELKTVDEYLEAGNYESLSAFLKDGRSFRDKLPEGKTGLISKLPELWINVSDRPGVIGEVATLLGLEGVNIKNLYIQNSREYEGGVLRITLSRGEDIEKTKEILIRAGYEIVKS